MKSKAVEYRKSFLKLIEGKSKEGSLGTVKTVYLVWKDGHTYYVIMRGVALIFDQMRVSWTKGQKYMVYCHKEEFLGHIRSQV